MIFNIPTQNKLQITKLQNRKNNQKSPKNHKRNTKNLTFQKIRAQNFVPLRFVVANASLHWHGSQTHASSLSIAIQKSCASSQDIALWCVLLDASS